MSSFALLVAPSANQVYADQAPVLAAAELAITAGLAGVEPVTVAGIDYLGFTADESGDLLAAVERCSARLALFERVGDLLRPVELPRRHFLDDDLVTIPKYPGKTNEQFTRLLLNVTLAAAGNPQRATVLDPICGRGTTLTSAWLLGHDAAGVEGDEKAVEAFAAFLKTYLRRKRLKHSADLTPVRREGKSLGRRFDATVRLDDRTLTLGVFTGDTRASRTLWGRRTFDAVVVDAPYGVVHGSHTDVRGVAGKRDRSAAGLLGEAVPVWARQLRAGGALGIAWNTLGMSREALTDVLAAAGLDVCAGPLWQRFGHRVDSSIHRDVIVGVRTA